MVSDGNAISLPLSEVKICHSLPLSEMIFTVISLWGAENLSSPNLPPTALPLPPAQPDSLNL